MEDYNNMYEETEVEERSGKGAGIGAVLFLAGAGLALGAKKGFEKFKQYKEGKKTGETETQDQAADVKSEKKTEK